MILNWLSKYRWRISGSVLVIATIILHIYRPNLAGFNSDSTTNTERDGAGKVIKTVEIEQSGKTLWDWLSVAGVPFVLTVLGIAFQQQEQRRSKERAKQERKRTDEQAQLERERVAE